MGFDDLGSALRQLAVQSAEPLVITGLLVALATIANIYIPPLIRRRWL